MAAPTAVSAIKAPARRYGESGPRSVIMRLAGGGRVGAGAGPYAHAQQEASMSKAQDSKKESKKEPAKTMKEKKEAKKVKKEERARQ